MLNDYPDILSGEQVRCILHISKRKCAWMLNSGMIKCTDTGKLTRRYTVRKNDLITYIKDSEKHPEKYVTPYGEFSAVKYDKSKATKPSKKGFPSSLPSGFRAWLEKEMVNLPDALSVRDVIVATGYTDNSVNRWLRKGWLKSITVPTGQIIAKDWLIDFYCSYGYTIAQMSDQHINLMKKYFKL